MQVTKGDNTAERPMWAEKGGLDFDGRAKWDAWTSVKASKSDKAQLNFVKVISVRCLKSIKGHFAFGLYIASWTACKRAFRDC